MILRTGNGNSECACGVHVACVWRAYGVRVRVCAVFVRACETVLEGGGGLKQDMLGITQSTKSVT